MNTKSFLTYATTSLLTVLLLVLSVRGQEVSSDSVLSGASGYKVVLENGFPALKFVSPTGSVAFIYFRKYKDEEAFAIEVVQRRRHFPSGWLYINKNRVAFESDEHPKDNFEISRDELKNFKGDSRWTGEYYLVIKYKSNEKKFFVKFVPVPPSAMGMGASHQKPVFRFIESLVTNYDAVTLDLQQQAAKLLEKFPIIQAPNQSRKQTTSELVPKGQTKTTIDISSEPLGAEIYVDGIFDSSTPSKLQLSIGEHTIRVTRPGFKDWERRVLIESGSSKALNAILEKKTP